MIAEPATTLLDFVLVAVLAVLAASMAQGGARGVSWPRALWAIAFAIGAIAAFTGGTELALGPSLDTFTRALLRQCALLGSALAAVLLLAGLAWLAAAGPARRMALAGLAVLLALEFVVVARSFATRDALWVGAANVAALLSLSLYQARRDPSALRWLVGGGALAAAGLVARIAGLEPHPQFGENALFRGLLAAALLPLYRAGLRLDD